MSTLLVGTHIPNYTNKVQVHWPLDFREEGLCRVLLYMGMATTLFMGPRTFVYILFFLILERLSGLVASEKTCFNILMNPMCATTTKAVAVSTAADKYIIMIFMLTNDNYIDLCFCQRNVKSMVIVT